MYILVGGPPNPVDYGRLVYFWLVFSTHLNNMSQRVLLHPQVVGLNMKISETIT